MIELGRDAVTGEGKLWMLAEDDLPAKNIHKTVDHLMQGGERGAQSQTVLFDNNAAAGSSSSATRQGASVGGDTVDSFQASTTVPGMNRSQGSSQASTSPQPTTTTLISYPVGDTPPLAEEDNDDTLSGAACVVTPAPASSNHAAALSSSYRSRLAVDVSGVQPHALLEIQSSVNHHTHTHAAAAMIQQHLAEEQLVVFPESGKAVSVTSPNTTDTVMDRSSNSGQPLQQQVSACDPPMKPADISPAAPLSAPPPATAKCIKIVPASSVASLRGKVPPDLNVLAQIEPQSDGSEIILPLGVFDRQQTMLPVDEAIRKFAGFNQESAAGAGVISSDVTAAPVQLDFMPNSAPNDSTTVLPSSSTAVTTTNPSAPESIVFMPAGGFIMTPPIPQHPPENESGSVPIAAPSAKTGTVPEKPAQNKRAGGIFRVKPKAENLSESGATDADSGGTPDSLELLNKSRLKPIKTRPVTQRGLASTSASAAKSVLPMLKPSPQLVTLSSGPVFGPRTNNTKANSNSARAHPSNLFLLTKPRDKNLLRTTNVDKSESQPSSPASQNVLFKFTLPKSATERLRELQRISQLTSATKAERDTAKTEMDEILDKHRHGATTVYESEDVSEEKVTAGTPPLEADSSLAAPKAVLPKPAAKKIVASRKPVSKQPTSSFEKFAGNLDAAAALHDDSVDVGPPAVTTSTRPPFLLKKPVVVSKPGARTVGQIVAAQQSVRHHDALTSLKPVADASAGTDAPAASSDAPSTATTKQRPAALRAKALFEMSAARSPSTSNVILPVKVEPAEAVLPAVTSTPERQTYTTIRPKRARNPPVKPKTSAQPTAGTLSRTGKNASSSNLSGIVKLENSLHLTPAKPTHDVFSPRSDADSQAVSEETRSYIPTPVMDDGDGVTGLVIDDDLSQSAISTRLRRRKPANSATPTEPDDSDEATQYAEKILEDDAEFEKFFRELDEHLNDEFGADSGIVDDYYEHVSARVDVECQLDQWTVKIMSPPPASVVKNRNMVDKNDIFGPLEGDDDGDDDNDYYETQLIRKNPLDQTTIDEECDNLFDDTAGKQPSPQTRKQKAARLSRMRSRPDQAVERFIDRDISRLEQHLADLPTWEDCGEPPEEVLMRFHLLQEGSCVRWARVRGHVLPLPYKLPFDVAESELRRQDGIFETVSRDLIARKQHLVEAGRTMMLNDQLKKHLYGPLEEHCILLRGLADLDELEVQNIRQQQYYVQTALYNAYGPYVASYTPEIYAAAVASLVDVGPAVRPEDVKHYFDWFEAQDRQLQDSTASTSAAATTASDTFQHGTSFPSDDLNTMATPSNNTVLSPRPEVLSTLPQLGTTFASTSSQSSSYTDAVSSVTYSDTIFHRTISAAPAETQSSFVVPPVVPESFRYTEDPPFVADDIFGQRSDAPQPLEKQGSIEEDLPSTPPPPILERMAETPTSLTMSPTKSVSTGPPVTAGSMVLESAGMSSYYDRTGSNSETTRRNTLSSASSGTGGRESREQQLSSSYSREPIFDAASIFGDSSDAMRRNRSASGSRSSSARRQSIHAGYADERKIKQQYADDESEDLSLPELEVQHVQESSKPRSKRRRHDSTASRKRGAPRRGSSQNELLDNSGSDDEGDMKSRSHSPMSSDEPPPPELSQPRESTPPPTRFKLTLKRAPLVSDASISSRTRNRRSAGTGAGTTRTDDVSAAVKAGDWCVAVVAAATSTSNERTAATKPSPSTASSSSTPDKPERRKRRRQRLNLREEEEDSRLRRNNSDLAIQQPQTRYGTRLAAKTIAQSEAKLQRKDRNRRGRRRRRRRHRTGSGSTDAENKQRNDRSRKNSGKEDHESEANDTKSDKSSSEGEADNGAATPPPLLEPMFGVAMEETPVIRPKTARHLASISAPKLPSGAQGRTSTNDAVGPSWLDSVFDDSSGRISSSSRHHPHPTRHQSGDNLLRSSTNNAVHSAPVAGTSSRLDTGDDDVVFEDFLDSEFDLSTFLSGNDMHNVLIATSNSMTPTLGGGGMTTLAHQHHHAHYTTDTSTAPPSSVMISQGNVFATQSTQFVPIRQESENIPRDAGPPQIFTYASHSTVSRETRIVPRPVLSILPGSGVGLGHVMVPPVLPTSNPLTLTTTAVHPSVATPPPPPLSTTNLDVIF